MKKVILTALLGSTVSVQAATTIPRTICPSVSVEAQNIVTNIETLRSQLKKGPECESISEKVSIINDTITNDNWKKFKEICSGESTTALEGEEIEE